MAIFCLIGFGELGAALSAGLGRSEDHEVRAFARPRRDPVAARVLQERLAATGASPVASLAEGLRGATAVIAAVPGSAAEEVAAACTPLLEEGTLYVDMTTAPPSAKARDAALVARRQARYVDAAVLGTVVTSGFEVSMLVSGPGAAEWQALVAPLGMNVEAIDAPAGHATLVKLLRSVYMKGRDALVLEMMLAARRYGLDEVVARSIGGPGETVPFASLAERVLRALAVHAERRAVELASSCAILEEAGVLPIAAGGGAQRLERLAQLRLREAFGGERPADGRALLDAVDRLTDSGDLGAH